VFCVGSSVAMADTGALSYDSCITSNTNVTGCAPIAGAVAGGNNTGLDNPASATISPDGLSVYAASGASDAVARFNRDPATGALTYVSCITSDTNVAGCTKITGATAGGTNTGLDGLVSLTASPDGTSVYTASDNGDAVARFNRDPATGALTYVDCVTSNTNVGPCDKIGVAGPNGTTTGLNGLSSVASSADGKSVYAVSIPSDAVSRFNRDPATGKLTYVGCITSDTNTAGCTPITGATAGGTNTSLDTVVRLTTSADGKSVYTASEASAAVARFDRDPAGVLTYAGCFTSKTTVAGCTPVTGATASGANTVLQEVEAVSTSPDNKSLYTAGGGGSALGRFDRDPATGALTYVSCISSNTNVGSCTQIPGATLNGANTGLRALQAVITSADGRSVYAAAINGDAIARFDRDPATGAVTYVSCISSNSSVTGCTPIAGATADGSNTGLDNPDSLTASADGKSIYAASATDDAVATFAREPEPLPPAEPPATPSNAFTLGKLTKNKKKGTAKLAVEVASAGEVTLVGKSLKPQSATTPAAGEVLLKVKATGKARKKLKKRGKAKLSATITFTPTGGSANSEPAKLKLVRKRG
jgi:hypothetical protein